MIKINRQYLFLLFTMLAFFAPLLLFKTSQTFIVVVPFTILIWFVARWQEIGKIEKRSNLSEILLAVGIYVSNLARNALGFSQGSQGIGLFDMLVAFVAVCIAFFGFKGFKYFVLPTAYLSIMIVGYQLEYSITEIAVFQNFLAGLMTSMLHLLGIGASVSDSTVTVHSIQGDFNLHIDVDCTGLKGILAYGSLAVLMIIEEKASYRRKALITAMGFIGTFILNIFRLFTIFLTCYFFGIEAALAVHAYIGYGIFIVWVLVFWTISFRYLLPPQPKKPLQSDLLHTTR